MFHNYHIEFATDRFDQRSGNPENINGFYGKEVIAYLAKEFEIKKTFVVSEDWGWLLEAEYGDITISYGISDWKNIDQQIGGNPHGKTEANWILVIDAWRRRKIFGFVPWRTVIPVPDAVVKSVIDLFRRDGIKICNQGANR